MPDSSFSQANTNQSKLEALPTLPFPPSKPVKTVGLSWPISLQDAQMIERSTVGQSCNSKWLILSRFPLTVSNFQRLAYRTRNAQGLYSSLFAGSKLDNIPAICHGRRNESSALQAYCDEKASSGSPVHVRSCGTALHVQYRYQGASPDAMVFDETEGNIRSLVCWRSNAHSQRFKRVYPLEML